MKTDVRFTTITNKRIVSIILLAMVLSACASKPTYQPNANIAKRTGVSSTAYQNAPKRYQVQSGDTVSKIATRYGLDWREVSRLNNLDSNHTIRVGQWLTLTGANPATFSAAKTPTTSTAPKVVTVKNPTVGSVGVMAFEYPVSKNNRVVRHFGEVANINGVNTKAEGMWFTGKNNDMVSASRSGTVIYVDNASTGGTISISHPDGFVSSYLHVKDISVRKGQQIGVGDPIAKMKQQNSGVVLMEFRIARNGVYIDPVTVLK